MEEVDRILSRATASSTILVWNIIPHIPMDIIIVLLTTRWNAPSFLSPARHIDMQNANSFCMHSRIVREVSEVAHYRENTALPVVVLWQVTDWAGGRLAAEGKCGLLHHLSICSPTCVDSMQEIKKWSFSYRKCARTEWRFCLIPHGPKAPQLACAM